MEKYPADVKGRDNKRPEAERARRGLLISILIRANTGGARADDLTGDSRGM